MPFVQMDDVDVFYREAGQGEPLLLLHGNTASSAVHAGELDFFGARFHVVAMDWPGCGQSSRVPFPEDLWWETAQTAHEFCRRLGLEAPLPLVVGTSGGGMVGLCMAIQASERLRAVVADSFVGETLRPEWVASVIEGRQPDGLAAGFWETAHGKDWWEVVQEDSAVLRAVAASGRDLFHGRLADIRCPVLVTGSLRDDLLDNQGWGMCEVTRKIPGARILLNSEGNHPLMWSQAALFRRTVLTFFDELSV